MLGPPSYREFSGFLTDRAGLLKSSIRWKLQWKGISGETPDIMRISLDQAERLVPSSSDVKVHYSFLRLNIGCDFFSIGGTVMSINKIGICYMSNRHLLFNKAIE